MYGVSPAFLAQVATSHVTVTTAEVWTPTGGQPLAVFRAVSGSVTIDRTRAQRRLMSATLVDPSGAFVPSSGSDLFQVYGNEIRLYRGVKYMDGTTEMVPLGVFGIDTVEISEDQGAVQIALSGSDRSSRISRARWTDPYAIAKGTNLSTAVDTLLATRFPGVPTALAATAYTTPAITFGANGQDQSSSDPWKDAVGLCADAGFDLYFDANGIAVSVPTPIQGVAAAVIAYGGSDVEVITAAKRSISNAEVYNGIIVTGEGSGVALPVRAEAWDMDPASPTYRLGPFGDVPTFYSSPLITTLQQAQDTANAMLAKLQGRNEVLEWDQVVNPALDAWDMVKITVPNLKVNRYCLIDTLTIPLEAGGAMSASTRVMQDLATQVTSGSVGTGTTNTLFTYVGGASNQVLSSATITFVIPAGAIAGDVLVFSVGEQGSSAATYSATGGSIPVGTPADQTQFQSADNMAVWSYVCKAGDGGQTVTITSSRTGHKTCAAMVVRNVGGATTDAIVMLLSPANSSAVATGSAPTAYPDDCVLTFHYKATATATTWTLPGGMTAGPTNDTGANATGSAIGSFYQLDAGITGTVVGPITSTASTSANPNCGTLVLLRVGAVSQPPPTRFPFVRGAALGAGNTRASVVTRLNPKHWRVFDDATAGGGVGYPATWAASNGGNLNSGDAWIYSIKPDLTILGGFPAGTTGGAYQTMRDGIRALLLGAPDVADNCWFAVHHEPEGDSGFTLAQFRQAQVNIALDVMPFVNAGRTHKIRFMVVLQGYTFNPTSGRSVSDYVDSTVLAVLDGIGSDVYKSNQIGYTNAWSKANGNIPWGIPEHGCDQGTANPDATINARMLVDIPAIAALSTAEQPVFDDWFNSGTNNLMPSPSFDNSAATWKAAS